MVDLEVRNELFNLVKMYNIVQGMRIALDNRVRVLAVRNELLEILDTMEGAIQKTERSVSRMIADTITEFDIYNEFLSKVKGVGPISSAKLIYFIKDVSRFPNVAKLWRYAGLGVIDGKAEKPVRGKPLSYNPEFKSLMYNIGVSMIRKKSKYKRIFDRAREYYTRNRDWTKNHIRLAAMRKMEKLFLSHVWAVWRSLEDLPIRDPYPVEYLGHTTILSPWEFVEED